MSVSTVNRRLAGIAHGVEWLKNSQSDQRAVHTGHQARAKTHSPFRLFKESGMKTALSCTITKYGESESGGATENHHQGDLRAVTRKQAARTKACAASKLTVIFHEAMYALSRLGINIP